MTIVEVDVSGRTGHPPGRRRTGEAGPDGKSKNAPARLTADALTALDALAARLVTSRSEMMRRAVRELLSSPPTGRGLSEALAAFEPRRPYGTLGPQFPWIPEAGQHAALAELAAELSRDVFTLIRYAVDQLLTVEDAQPGGTPGLTSNWRSS